MRTYDPHRLPIAAILTAGLLACCGCSVLNRSHLASSTGPSSEDKKAGSLVAEHWAHVGEKVEFTYAVHSGGIPDYAILEVQPVGLAKVSLIYEAGRFYFTPLTFDQPTTPGKPLTVKAFAYRQRDERDHMDDNGRLLSRESPSNVADALISSTQIKLHVYQSNLAMEVPASPAGYRWETARLTLHGDGDLPAEIQPARTYRKGFRISDPSPSGNHVVTYEPAADQVKHTGTTRVVLTVQDTKGQQHQQDLFLPTP